MKIEYHEVDIHHVWEFWVQAYGPEHGKIIKHEAYYDPVKERVVFKLYVVEDTVRQGRELKSKL